jgi:hypothetical protein
MPTASFSEKMGLDFEDMKQMARWLSIMEIT